MQLAPLIDPTVLNYFPGLASLKELEFKAYSEQFAYGDCYSQTLSYLEQSIDLIYPNISPEELKSINNLMFALYHNDNHILEDGEWINKLNQKIRPKSSDPKKLITQELKDPPRLVNTQSPNTAEGPFNRFYTLFTPNFKPQLETNVPSIKHHKYNSNIKSIEYRISTQGQRHHSKARVSPLFKYWLAINAERSLNNPISHIYFNNLGIDRDSFDIPGKNEQQLSAQLHRLEQLPSLKIAVITLPASKGLMNEDHYKLTTKNLCYYEVFYELLAIACEHHHSSKIADFKISPQIRRLLFGDDKTEFEILQKLLRKSFEAMGIRPGNDLSPAQRQAAWLHFIKFELTHYILEKLQPNSYNFSCKDAIDRGIVSSLYFYLHHSFSLNQAMTRQEFERDIDIAAANVKGRGMNFHRKILWNVIDCFVNANYEELFKDSKKAWLIYWRDMNCPHSRVSSLLDLRIQQYEQQLKKLPDNQIKTHGFELLTAIKKLHEGRVNGQRLFLEIISRSTQLLSEKPTADEIQAYKKLGDELKIKHPRFDYLAGLLLKFLGSILNSSSLYEQGQSKLNTLFFLPEREQLRKTLLFYPIKEDNEEANDTCTTCAQTNH